MATPESYNCFLNIAGNFVFRNREVAFMHLIDHGKGYLTFCQEAFIQFQWNHRYKGLA